MHEAPEMWLEIGSWLHLWMPIVFAVLCWSPPQPHEQRLRLARRFLKCVGFGWLIQVVIRLGIIVPAHNVTAAEPNDGANVAVLLAAWAVAVIMAIPFVLVAIVLDWFRERNRGLVGGR